MESWIALVELWTAFVELWIALVDWCVVELIYAYFVYVLVFGLLLG